MHLEAQLLHVACIPHMILPLSFGVLLVSSFSGQWAYDV